MDLRNHARRLLLERRLEEDRLAAEARAAADDRDRAPAVRVSVQVLGIGVALVADVQLVAHLSGVDRQVVSHLARVTEEVVLVERRPVPHLAAAVLDAVRVVAVPVDVNLPERIGGRIRGVGERHVQEALLIEVGDVELRADGRADDGARDVVGAALVRVAEVRHLE